MNWSKSANIALFVSAAINLLLVGFLAGQVLPDKWLPGPLAQQPGGGAPPRPVPQGMPGWTRNELDIVAGLQALREPDRAVVRRIVNQRTPEVRASLQELQAKRRAVLALLNDPPADTSALESALADLNQASAAAQKRGQEVFLEIAKALPEGARMVFLKAAGAARAERRAPRMPPPPRG